MNDELANPTNNQRKKNLDSIRKEYENPRTGDDVVMSTPASIDKSYYTSLIAKIAVIIIIIVGIAGFITSGNNILEDFYNITHKNIPTKTIDVKQDYTGSIDLGVVTKYYEKVKDKPDGSYSLTFNDDGTKMYIAGKGEIEEYHCTFEYDLSTCTFDSSIYRDSP